VRAGFITRNSVGSRPGCFEAIAHASIDAECNPAHREAIDQGGRTGKSRRVICSPMFFADVVAAEFADSKQLFCQLRDAGGVEGDFDCSVLIGVETDSGEGIGNGGSASRITTSIRTAGPG